MDCVLCMPGAARFVSSAVTDFPQQINAHAVAMGIIGCVCLRMCGGSEGESGLVSNVIETNKINANYLVFQFVTLHYSAQLINAGFFHASALATYLSLCFFLAAPKQFPQCSLMPSHRVDLLIVLFHINFI